MTPEETARRARLLYVTLGFLGLDLKPEARPPGPGGAATGRR